MSLKPLLLRAVNDYKNNLVFVLPRLMEYIIDLGIFFTAIMTVALITGLVLDGFSYERLLRPFPEIPFSVVAALLAGVVVVAFLVMSVSAASRGAIIAMAMDTYGGSKTSPRRGIDGVKKYAPRILLYFILLLGGFISVVLLFSIFISLLSGSKSFVGPFIAFFLLAFALVGLLAFYVFTLFAPQVMAAKDAGVIDGLKGSALFVRHNLSKVAMYGGVVFLLTVIVGGFVSLTFFIINEVTRYNPFLNLAAKIFRNILAFALGIIISPYFEIVKTYMVIEAEGKSFIEAEAESFIEGVPNERAGKHKEEENEGTTGEDKG